MRVVALPAQIWTAVGGNIDLRRILLWGVLGVARAAEFPPLGYGGGGAPWLRLVPVGHGVAGRAAEEGVAGDGLGPLDLRVAGLACLGRLPGHRVVGVVALDAGLEWIVGREVDLWEAGGSGGIVDVAHRAGLPVPRGGRLPAHGVLGVLGRRAMAPLAGEGLVVSPAGAFGNLAVTHLTG